ncbi:TetR/AcrR family transcriptional regulator [Alkalibacter mobilis]|uniref:TetR/AcrR family transcriptional regulator n=1 Tax=Alkalibacter mobilis TaxID=2787712 RepID=UPI00189E2CCF|nr:TetR/AcrR family transcriptional regulator [Alkalibacter mobilis]MBF7097017.1 TetR/AcrR family transcriptional regulator [Alkalibacter mobilis]
MSSTTIEKIKNVSFKFFLEKGYEASNIREICKVVQIKPASLYFHYESKKALFFNIYDEIWNEKLTMLAEIRKQRINETPDQLWFFLYRGSLEFCMKDISKNKFLMRYHLFPPEELMSEITKSYREWTEKENSYYLEAINKCMEMGILKKDRHPKDHLRAFKVFESFNIYEMILSNIRKTDTEIKEAWEEFLSKLM